MSDIDKPRRKTISPGKEASKDSVHSLSPNERFRQVYDIMENRFATEPVKSSEAQALVKMSYMSKESLNKFNRLKTSKNANVRQNFKNSDFNKYFLRALANPKKVAKIATEAYAEDGLMPSIFIKSFGLKPNQRTFYISGDYAHCTPMQLAMYLHDVAEVKELIKLGAKVDTVSLSLLINGINQYYTWWKHPDKSMNADVIVINDILDVLKKAGVRVDDIKLESWWFNDFIEYVRSTVNHPYATIKIKAIQRSFNFDDDQYGGAKVNYAGKQYIVKTGERGGKYICVGKQKKKVYV